MAAYIKVWLVERRPAGGRSHAHRATFTKLLDIPLNEVVPPISFIAAIVITFSFTIA